MFLHIHFILYGSLQETVDKEVATLLALKAEYKTLTGVELSGGRQPKGGKDKKDKAPQGQKKEHKPAASDSGREVKKVTR